MDEKQIVNRRATASGRADISIWAASEASKVRYTLNVQQVRAAIYSDVPVMLKSPSWEHSSMSRSESMV
jgi:hypothetical protein